VLSVSADGVRGHVRVHASISAIVQFLPEDLGRFARQHPEVKIDLEEHLSGDVLRAVQEGAADIGICNVSAASHGPGVLQVQPYRQDRLALIVPTDHVLSVHSAIDFEDSLAFDHVGLHANSSIALAMRQAAAQAGQAIRLRIRVTGLDAMCRMIDNGLGVGVMPQRAFALMRGDSALKALPLTNAWAQRTLCLAARDFKTLPVTARALVEHLRHAPTATVPPQT
jgi:DNA-binding transcriptional LysR family regulator